jgi:Flp pilus assembly pilin Flp
MFFVKAWLAASSIQDRLRREEGQAITEYALVVGLIAVGAIVALTALSGRINGKLGAILP